MDLMDASLTRGLPMEMLRVAKQGTLGKRVVYVGSSNQSTLCSMVFGFADLLRMEKGLPDTVDLDDPILWRQQKVKAKALQFFAILTGRNPDAALLRIAFDELCNGKGYTTGAKGNLHQRLIAAGYSEATVKAQVSQTVALFLNLRIIVKSRPQVYVINPVSLLYERALRAFGKGNQ